MLTLILAAALTQAGAMPIVDPNANAHATCPPTSRYEAAKKGGKLGKRDLGNLPAADLYKSVYRRIDGCMVPVIAGYGFGLPTKTRR
jgi:hypothetical protein